MDANYSIGSLLNDLKIVFRSFDGQKYDVRLNAYVAADNESVLAGTTAVQEIARALLVGVTFPVNLGLLGTLDANKGARVVDDVVVAVNKYVQATTIKSVAP